MVFLKTETSLVFAMLFSLNSVEIHCFLELNVLATMKNLSSRILGINSFACSSMQNPWTMHQKQELNGQGQGIIVVSYL